MFSVTASTVFLSVSLEFVVTERFVAMDAGFMENLRVFLPMAEIYYPPLGEDIGINPDFF
jgi:hypothetical protein